MEEVAKAFSVSLNLAHRWRAETGRHRPRAGWEVVLAAMAERGAAANRTRALLAEKLAQELQEVGTPFLGQ
jgi:hypothetical protein